VSAFILKLSYGKTLISIDPTPPAGLNMRWRIKREKQSNHQQSAAFRLEEFATVPESR